MGESPERIKIGIPVFSEFSGILSGVLHVFAGRDPPAFPGSEFPSVFFRLRTNTLPGILSGNSPPLRRKRIETRLPFGRLKVKAMIPVHWGTELFFCHVKSQPLLNPRIDECAGRVLSYGFPPNRVAFELL